MKITTDKLLEIAIERIKPYLNEEYEMDDISSDNDAFCIHLYDVCCPGSGCAGRFYFCLRSWETEEEMIERFNEEVEEIIQEWR